jgi:hypothetical protein
MKDEREEDIISTTYPTASIVYIYNDLSRTDPRRKKKGKKKKKRSTLELGGQRSGYYDTRKRLNRNRATGRKEMLSKAKV